MLVVVVVEIEDNQVVAGGILRSWALAFGLAFLLVAFEWGGGGRCFGLRVLLGTWIDVPRLFRGVSSCDPLWCLGFGAVPSACLVIVWEGRGGEAGRWFFGV